MDHLSASTELRKFTRYGDTFAEDNRNIILLGLLNINSDSRVSGSGICLAGILKPNSSAGDGFFCFPPPLKGKGRGQIRGRLFRTNN